MDIVMNMDEPFTAEEVKQTALDNYGLYYDVREVESVIAELTALECVEFDRCDKTADLFAGVAA